ncbi:hypothetical protein N0V82_007134 [Gnomoniopsis sp. IMI 355080]|nr:hypothetical protein N0V82_007134 [Gnomoniopsis sp. IMI 355080]
MLFRPASFLLPSLSFGALASTTLGNGVKTVKVPDGTTEPDFGKGYWLQEIHVDKATTMVNKDLQDAAKQGRETAKTTAPNVKLPSSTPNGAKVFPSYHDRALGHGTIVASSFKTRKATQSVQTCKVIMWQHRNFANCAEPNPLAITMQQG